MCVSFPYTICVQNFIPTDKYSVVTLERPVEMVAGLHVMWPLKLSNIYYGINGMTASYKTLLY